MNRRLFFQSILGLAAIITSPIKAASNRFIGKRRVMHAVLPGEARFQSTITRLAGDGGVTVIVGKNSLPLKFTRASKALGYDKDGMIVEYGENVPRIEGMNYFPPKAKP